MIAGHGGVAGGRGSDRAGRGLRRGGATPKAGRRRVGVEHDERVFVAGRIDLVRPRLRRGRRARRRRPWGSVRSWMVRIIDSPFGGVQAFLPPRCKEPPRELGGCSSRAGLPQDPHPLHPAGGPRPRRRRREELFLIDLGAARGVRRAGGAPAGGGRGRGDLPPPRQRAPDRGAVPGGLVARAGHGADLEDPARRARARVPRHGRRGRRPHPRVPVRVPARQPPPPAVPPPARTARRRTRHEDDRRAGRRSASCTTWRPT